MHRIGHNAGLPVMAMLEHSQNELETPVMKACKWVVVTAVFSSTLLCRIGTGIVAGSEASKSSWILWKQLSSLSFEGGHPTERTNEWVVERALDSMSACQEILEHVIDVHKKGERHPSVKFVSRVGTNSGVAIISGKGKDDYPWSFTYEYRCIPDTIDPRAPKR